MDWFVAYLDQHKQSFCEMVSGTVVCSKWITIETDGDSGVPVETGQFFSNQEII